MSRPPPIPEKMSDRAGERDSLPLPPKKEERRRWLLLPPKNKKEIKTPEELKAEYPDFISCISQFYSFLELPFSGAYIFGIIV